MAALGHWTREGSTTATQYRCSPGKYADREGSTSSSCTGSCDHGFYCTSGAVSRRQHACGHPGVYCPTGSKKPTRVSRGYYTLPEDAAVDRVVGKVNTQVREMCFIVYGVHSCHFHCHTIMKCCCVATILFFFRTFRTLYLHMITAHAFCFDSCFDMQVHVIEGWHGERRGQLICAPGHYCARGVRSKCPAGRYGSTSGLYKQRCR